MAFIRYGTLAILSASLAVGFESGICAIKGGLDINLGASDVCLVIAVVVPTPQQGSRTAFVFWDDDAIVDHDFGDISVVVS